MISLFKEMRDAMDWVKRPEKVQKLFQNVSQKAWLEVLESKDMLDVFWRLSTGQSVTTEARQKALEQAKNLAKSIPAFGIFLLPGGMILLPIVAKLVPWQILPVSFQNNEPTIVQPEDDQSDDKKLDDSKNP